MSRVKTFPSLPDCVPEMLLWKATRAIPTLAYSRRRPCNRKWHSALQAFIPAGIEKHKMHLGNNSASLASASLWPLQGLPHPARSLGMLQFHQAAGGVLSGHLHISIYLFLYSSPLQSSLSYQHCCCRIFPSRFPRTMSPMTQRRWEATCLGLLNISAPLEEYEGASFNSVGMCVSGYGVDTKAFCNSLFYSAFLITASWIPVVLRRTLPSLWNGTFPAKLSGLPVTPKPCKPGELTHKPNKSPTDKNLVCNGLVL